ncbi:hypothetical protein ScPMuIL_001292 [Solemya velum]
MSLTDQKISELKQIIHNQLSHMDVQGRIKTIISETLHDEFPGRTSQVSEQELLDRLKQRGLLDDIMQQIQFESIGSVQHPATHFVDQGLSSQQQHTRKTNIDPNRRHLLLTIKYGKAFLEHIGDSEPLPGQVTSYFTIHIYFRNQRFRSRPVPCAVEPQFDETFLLEVHKDAAGDAARMADSTTLLSVADPVHLVIIRTDPTGETTLITSHFFEWRPVLACENNKMATSVELKGTGSESKVTAGVLELHVELVPKSSQTIGQEIISAQLKLERSRQAERERLFLVYAKQWWKEYLQIRPTHQERLIKIFSPVALRSKNKIIRHLLSVLQDENGYNRPTCSFLKPLRAGRLLDTARQAARFVSLLHHEKTQTLGGGDKVEQWSNMHTFLCRNRGDTEDHAVLLCSLLLGFGLDAYVCVGTKAKGSLHCWVVTITVSGVVMFWESLNGHRFIHQAIDPNDPPMDKRKHAKYPYKTVGCVFNHEAFYANSQPSDAVEVCVFNLQDESRWKGMSHDAIRSVCGMGSGTWPPLPPLCASSVDSSLVSNDLEQQLRVLVVEHRQNQGLTTVWDDQLSYLLTPALSAYETERITGTSISSLLHCVLVLLACL